MTKYAILGFGTVGVGLAEVIEDQKEKMAAAAAIFSFWSSMTSARPTPTVPKPSIAYFVIGTPSFSPRPRRPG